MSSRWQQWLHPGDLRRQDAAWPVPALAAVAAALALLLFSVVSVLLVFVGGPVVAVVLAATCVVLVFRTAYAGLDLYAVPLALATILSFDFFYLEPLRSFSFPDPQNWGALALYLVVIVLVCAVSARTRSRIGTLDEAQVALHDEMSALRRIARLTTAEATPAAVFAVTAEEIGRLAYLEVVCVMKYESDGSATVVAVSADPEPVTVGQRTSLDGDSVALRVLRSGQAERLDDYRVPYGPLAEQVWAGGVRSALGYPIVLGGRLWGVMSVGSRHEGPIPVETEARIANFTELVALAFSNARDRAELIASRARIVDAVDDARRRLERDLHDGIQQRLVSLALDVRRVQARVPQDLDDVRSELRGVGETLVEVVDELREVARGIHPAILETGGLRVALRSLARRSALPVLLDADIAEALPGSVEVAAYYLVSEAITNATKHARAAEVRVRVAQSASDLVIEVSDDGVGGADRGRGSGLLGMEDRVHALGGRIVLTSEPGEGTTLVFTLPTA